jgi:AhpD family alkylhydroperoxidase
MTTSETSPATTSREPLDFESHAAGVYRAISHLDHAATAELDRAQIEPRLRELVRIRASQLNGCAYCIDMHTKDARAIGESEQRLYALPAWRETPFFTERERAALSFCEAVTGTPVAPSALSAVAGPFSEAEIAAILGLIVAINAWNAIGASTHAWEPGSYEP